MPAGHLLAGGGGAAGAAGGALATALGAAAGVAAGAGAAGGLAAPTVGGASFAIAGGAPSLAPPQDATTSAAPASPSLYAAAFVDIPRSFRSAWFVIRSSCPPFR